MTTKAFSQNKMGRNPFGTKTTETATSKGSAKPTPNRPTSAASKNQENALFTALLIPYKGIILGIKSWLVAHYVLTHPKEWGI